MDMEETRSNLTHAIAMSLGADRFDEAWRLIDSGSVRAGVALMGMLLEQTLRHLLVTADLIDVRLRGSFSRKMTMSQSLQKLVKTGRISGDEKIKLGDAIRLRNRAVHDLREPNREEAVKAYNTISDFIHTHLLTDE